VEERYKKFLGSKPVEKLTLEFKEDEELDKEEYSKVKATIQEMIMKALPKGLKTEAIQKRCATPQAVMLMIMVKYQPGTRKEKEALLEQIQNPESCYNQEKALNNLKMWKRRIERAKELKASIPDPVILLNALDTITYNAVHKDQRRLFRVNAAREALSVDTITTEEGVQKIALLIEGEIEDAITGTWTQVSPKVKSMKGNGKGKDIQDARQMFQNQYYYFLMRLNFGSKFRLAVMDKGQH
jgi:hypothetical protein